MSNLVFLPGVFNGIDLCGGEVYVEEDGEQEFSIVSTKRVGVDVETRGQALCPRLILF